MEYCTVENEMEYSTIGKSDGVLYSKKMRWKTIEWENETEYCTVLNFNNAN